MKKKSNLLLVIGALAFFVGSGLVVSTLQGGDDALAAGDVAATVLVAREPIPPGTAGDDAVKDGLVVARELEPGDVAADAITSAEALAGRILDVELAPGEQVRAAHLRPPTLRAAVIEIPAGKQGVAVQLPFVGGGAGYVGAGDRVNVYGNSPGPDGVPVTRLVLENVEVLDVSTEVAPRVAGTEERPMGSTVTYLLALDVPEAEQVIHFAANAELWLALTA